MFLIRLLGSHRFAAVLCGLLALAAIVGGTLPQAPRMTAEEKSGWETDWSAWSTWLDYLSVNDVTALPAS